MTVGKSESEISFLATNYIYIYIYIWVVVKIMAPFLGALNNRCRIIIGTEKGTLILTTTHIYIYTYIHIFCLNNQ